jgi:multidrug efflux system membrane fusion protein
MASTLKEGRFRMKGLASMICLGLLGVALVLGGCDREGAGAATAGGRPPAVVTTVPARSADVPVYLDQIGHMVSMQVVSIVPQVGGKLIAAHVEDGADVEKGQLLFEIDPRPFEAALASARASLQQAEAQRNLAHIEFQRAEDLVRRQAVSALELEQRRADLSVADARVEAARAAIRTAELDLAYTKIHAPVTGRAGALLVHPGNVVKANDAPLLVIQQLDPIYAEFTVNDNDLGTVRKYLATAGIDRGPDPTRGLKVLVDVPGDSRQILSALGTPKPATQPGPVRPGPRDGALTFLDNRIEDRTGTVRLRATVGNADRYFWPGQFVNVRVVLTVKKDAVLIPAAAQQVGQQGPYVFVVTPDSKAEMRSIRPGQRQGEDIVIEQGLQPGEAVVLTGQMMIQPGAAVQVMAAQPAQGQVPGPAQAAGPAQAPATQPAEPQPAGNAAGASSASGGAAADRP